MYENSKALVRFGLAYVAEGVLESMGTDVLLPVEIGIRLGIDASVDSNTDNNAIIRSILLTLESEGRVRRLPEVNQMCRWKRTEHR